MICGPVDTVVQPAVAVVGSAAVVVPWSQWTSGCCLLGVSCGPASENAQNTQLIILLQSCQ